jgi:hypothetical protein
MPNHCGVRAGPYVAASATVVTGVLAVRAWQADLAAPGGTAGRASLDVGVGVLLAGAALLLLARPLGAVLVGAAGATWLLGSACPLGTLHQGFLVLALGSTSAAGLRSLRSLPLVVTAAVCAWGGGGQLVSGASCLVVAALSVIGRERRSGRLLRAAGASVLGVVLLTSWTLERIAWNRLDPDVLPVAYELAVVAAAGCLVAAVRVPGGPARRVRRAMRRPAGPGSERRQALVEDLLRHALRDPGLTLDLDWSPAAGSQGSRSRLVVGESGEEIAVVVSSSPLLDDTGVAAAVAEVVRPVAASARLQRQQEHQVEELRRSRARLIAAVDEERAVVVARLRRDPLRRLEDVIGALTPLAGAGAASPDVGTALEQLERAREEVLAVVRGSPPVDLGDGAIVDALRQVAGTSPLDVEVALAGRVAASRQLETAAFYVCSEALTNAARHSGARRARVELSQPDGRLVLKVSDDGRGGADPSGSGLRGLADRVEATGGSLTVISPAGAGTTVIARLGGVSRRSAATA